MGTRVSLSDILEMTAIPLRKFVAVCLLLFAATCGFAQTNIEPDIFTLTFSEKSAAWLDGTGQRPGHWPDWVQGLDHRNGHITEDGAWRNDPNVAETESAFSILIDNEALTSDLALTLAFSTEAESDFVVQIYDAESKVLAVDLFGNLNENSVLAGTDTYIVPVSKYPTASRITLRRVSGQLTLFGLVAFPALAELPSDTGAEMTMLKLLGGELSENSLLYQALNNVIPDSEKSGIRDEGGELLSREEIIASIRAEIVQELSKNETEFEKRLIGTEWYLEDFYRKRLARFLPDGQMLQQHVDGEENQVWNDELPLLDRSYRVLDNKSVLFGIGGFIATFDDNFTEMNYETASGRKGRARLVGRFTPGK